MKRSFSLPGHEGNRTGGEGDEQYGNERVAMSQKSELKQKICIGNASIIPASQAF
jgi:hypothetical protein